MRGLLPRPAGRDDRQRAGLASAVNNTARQAGGAIGIAALGAVAGSPSRTDQFLVGMRSSALIAAVLYGLAAVMTVLFISANPDGG